MPGHIQSATPRKRNKRLLVYLAVIIALLMLTRCSLEHQFLYFPTARQETTPAKVGLSYEAVNFTAIDGAKLSGWLVPGDPGAPVVLFCIGNAGNISHRLESLQIFNRLGLSVLIVDYRGYGRSSGTPGEEGTYRDAEAAWKYLVSTRGIPPGRIVIFGRSLGGAVGAWLASRPDVRPWRVTDKTPLPTFMRTANRSPARPAAKRYPAVAP